MTRWNTGRALLVAVTGSLLTLCSCNQDSQRLTVYPVKGKLLIGGKKVKGVHLWFWPVNGAASVGAYCPKGETNEEGEFTLSTYVENDGAPAGKYHVTVEWPERFNPLSNSWEGDKLMGRYADPKASRILVQIPPQATSLQTIRLDK